MGGFLFDLRSMGLERRISKASCGRFARLGERRRELRRAKRKQLEGEAESPSIPTKNKSPSHDGLFVFTVCLRARSRR